MRRIYYLLICAGCLCCAALGCSHDIMYGPDGELIKMKSPDRTMKIEVDGDEVQIEGARGIGGKSRVRMPAVPVETEESVAIEGVMVPQPGAKPHVPAVPAGNSYIIEEKEIRGGEETVVH